MSSPLTAEWTAALGSFYASFRVAPKTPMSCSPEKTLLVGDLRSLEWTVLWEQEIRGFLCDPSSLGSRVQPWGKDRQGSRLESQGSPTLRTRHMCQRETTATHEEHEEQAGAGV